MRLLVATLLVAALAACSGSSTCDISNCSGCCDASGTCQSGVASSACGANGAACASCGGGACLAGACRGSGGDSGGSSGSGGSTGSTGSNGTNGTNGCTPATCEALGANCGSLDDGCGGTLDCGTCSGGLNCGGAGAPNICGSGTCTPATCDGLNADCGPISDGCSALLQCGTCTSGESCGGAGVPNQCAQGSCTPKTCSSIGATCGDVSDGCSHTLHCGTCGTGESCGGAGVANQCGVGTCTPSTCGSLGALCGAPSDGCGHTLSCGGCSSPLTCGGGGVAYQCGGACANDCPSGYSCDASGICTGSSDTVNFNITAPAIAHVAGALTVNGAAVNCTETSGYAIGVLGFDKASSSNYDPGNEQAYLYCTNGQATYAIDMYPGTYNVGFGYTSDTEAPLPQFSVPLATSLAITGNSTYNFNITSPAIAQVSGALTVNGAAVNCTETSGYAIGELSFTKASSSNFDPGNEQAYLYCTNGQATYSAQLYPGSYDVAFSYTSDTEAPLPQFGVSLATSLAITGNSTYNFNITAPAIAHVAGALTVNGAAVNCTETSGYAIGVLGFDKASSSNYDPGNEQAYLYCTNGQATYAIDMYPGTYNVGFGYTSDTEAPLPQFSVPLATSLAITGNSTYNFNITSPAIAQVSGALTVNGAAVNCTETSGYAIGELSFTKASSSNFDPGNEQAYLYCTNGQATYSAQLYPGSYDVAFSYTSDTEAPLPQFGVSLATSLAITGNSTYNFNITAPAIAHVAGALTVNGAAVNCTETSGYAIGVLGFDKASSSNYDPGNEQAYLYCTNGQATYAIDMYPGTYNVGFGYTSDTEAPLPQFSVPLATSLAITGNSTYNFNITAPALVQLAGTLTVNGAAVNCTETSGYAIGELAFTRASNSNFDPGSEQAYLYCTNGQATYSIELYPGTYNVAFSYTSDTEAPLPEFGVTLVQRIEIQ